MTLDVKSINPKLNPAYSPNLFKFVKKHLGKDMPECRIFGFIGERAGYYKAQLFIGHQPDDWNDGMIAGAYLDAVLCHGAGVETVAFPFRWEETEEVRDFWERYLKIGRCVIDPGHQVRFMFDDPLYSRYRFSGDERICNWCGARFHRIWVPHTEMEWMEVQS